MLCKPALLYFALAIVFTLLSLIKSTNKSKYIIHILFAILCCAIISFLCYQNETLAWGLSILLCATIIMNKMSKI